MAKKSVKSSSEVSKRLSVTVVIIFIALMIFAVTYAFTLTKQTESELLVFDPSRLIRCPKIMHRQYVCTLENSNQATSFWNSLWGKRTEEDWSECLWKCALNIKK